MLTSGRGRLAGTACHLFGFEGLCLQLFTSSTVHVDDFGMLNYCRPPEAAANVCKLSHARGLGNANSGGTGGTGISAGEVVSVSLSQPSHWVFSIIGKIL